MVHGLEADYVNQVNFIYLDIDDSRTDRFKRELGYVYQPHLFLLDDQGNVITQWLGIVEKDVLEEALIEAVQ